MHHGGTQIEAVAEAVVEVGAQQRFFHQAEGVLALERHLDWRARNKVTLVDNLDAAHIVIDGVIDILCESYAARRHHNRPLRNVERVERNLGPARRFVRAFQVEFALGGHLLGLVLR